MTTKICPVCGAELVKIQNGEMCPNCGTDVTQLSSEEENPSYIG